MKKIRVLVADDHAVIREGLRKLVNGQADMEVIGEAREGQEAIEQVRMLRPDVALLDIVMPGMSGLSAVGLIREAFPDTRVVVFSMHKKEAYVEQALASGALGYVPKTAPASEIFAAIRAAHRGEYFLSSRVGSSFVKNRMQNTGRRSEADGYNSLSGRERQVFLLMVDGNSVQRIADVLCLSPKTVEKHRAAVIKKLDRHSLIEMVVYAFKIGIIDCKIPID